MSEIAVVGLGYVGLSSAVGLAGLKHKVTGIDINPVYVEKLSRGILPFFEPGLEEILLKQLESQALAFFSSYEAIAKTTEFVFLCVSTPKGEIGGADLSYLKSAINALKLRLSPGAIVVIKSTVPIGTCLSIASELERNGIQLVSNPEFLSEGNAVRDFTHPSRIVIGSDSMDAAKKVDELFREIDSERVFCSLTSAETIKHASNSLLAVKLSFVNELAHLCEKTGANFSEVALGISLDKRIGEAFLSPGPGWGGSCFPKDSAELDFTASGLGVEMHTVRAALRSNTETSSRIVNQIIDQLGGSVGGKKIAVWGLAFKANTDDVRESPAVKISASLASKGAIVSAYDPKATSTPEGVTISDSALEACRDAEALLVLTEWQDFREIDAASVQSVMAADPLVYDARRILDQSKWVSFFPSLKVVGQ